MARGGLTARGCFYLLLAYLAAAVAAGWGRTGVQVNAHGALTTVAAAPGGWLALAGAAVGFAAFGVVRLASAYADRRVGGWRRLSTAGQAAMYLAMAAGTVAFLVGDRSAGSTRQNRSTVMMLVQSEPGRIVLLAAGVTVVGVCLWQLWLAVQGGFADSLVTEQLSRRDRRALHLVGRIGIVARAAAVLPVGALLVLAAAVASPGKARDLDQLLDVWARDPVGRVLVWAAAAGFVVFGLYSFVEARFRAVHAGS